MRVITSTVALAAAAFAVSSASSAGPSASAFVVGPAVTRSVHRGPPRHGLNPHGTRKRPRAMAVGLFNRRKVDSAQAPSAPAPAPPSDAPPPPKRPSDAPPPPNLMVVGSVAALAATPAAEVRVMILDLSENMQPEAFKAFVVRIASALPPGVHKGLASRFARQTAGDFGFSAAQGVLSKRVAKTVVLAWLSRTPATELQELIGTAFTTLDDQTIGSVVPAMTGFVERSTNRSVDLVVQDMIEHNATFDVENNPARVYDAVNARSVFDGETGAVKQVGDGGHEAEAEENWAQFWKFKNWGGKLPFLGGDGGEGGSDDGRDGGAVAANATQTAWPVPDLSAARASIQQLSVAEANHVLALAEPSLEEAIAMADKTESAAALYNALCVPPGASAMVVTLPVWAKLRLLAKEGLPFPDVWPEAVVDATLLAAPPTKQALRTVAETEQEVREMVSAVVKAAQLDEVGEGVEDGAVEADATTMSVALSGAAVEEGGDARFDGFESGFEALGMGLEGLLSKDKAGDVGDIANPKPTEGAVVSGAEPLGLVLGQVFEQLPPSVISVQLAELVESIPPAVLSEEIYSIVEVLPPSSLMELAERLVETLPPNALRALAREIVEPMNAPDRVVQPGGVPKDTAALAAEVVRGCSDDFLRRTALELLGGVKPLMLQQKLLNVISGLGPEGLSKRILTTLKIFGERTARFSSFKAMREASLSPEVAEDENNGGRLVLKIPKPKPGIFAAVKKSASRLTGRRRMRVVRNVVLEVPPDLLLVKILETLSSLPPETFAALSQETAKALWALLVSRAGARQAAALATGLSGSSGLVTGALLGTTSKGALATKAGMATFGIKSVGGMGGTAAASLGVGAAKAAYGTTALAKAIAIATALAAVSRGAAYKTGAADQWDLAPLVELAILGGIVVTTSVVILLAGAPEGEGLGIYMPDWLKGPSPSTAKRLLLELAKASPACRAVLVDQVRSVLAARADVEEAAGMAQREAEGQEVAQVWAEGMADAERRTGDGEEAVRQGEGGDDVPARSDRGN
mmetsp:Transcript_38000/g.103674  ORF Transcript_38000/g.103674 Transcript_38000/m.103674 type:complete len:1035 (+) Transcript_38000:185-3289(+)